MVGIGYIRRHRPDLDEASCQRLLAEVRERRRHPEVYEQPWSDDAVTAREYGAMPRVPERPPIPRAIVECENEYKTYPGFAWKNELVPATNVFPVRDSPLNDSAMLAAKPKPKTLREIYPNFRTGQTEHIDDGVLREYGNVGAAHIAEPRLLNGFGWWVPPDNTTDDARAPWYVDKPFFMETGKMLPCGEAFRADEFRSITIGRKPKVNEPTPEYKVWDRAYPVPAPNVCNVCRKTPVPTWATPFLDSFVCARCWKMEQHRQNRESDGTLVLTPAEREPATAVEIVTKELTDKELARQIARWQDEEPYVLCGIGIEHTMPVPPWTIGRGFIPDGSCYGTAGLVVNIPFDGHTMYTLDGKVLKWMPYRTRQWILEDSDDGNMAPDADGNYPDLTKFVNKRPSPLVTPTAKHDAHHDIKKERPWWWKRRAALFATLRKQGQPELAEAIFTLHYVNHEQDAGIDAALALPAGSAKDLRQRLLRIGRDERRDFFGLCSAKARRTRIVQIRDGVQRNITWGLNRAAAQPKFYELLPTTGTETQRAWMARHRRRQVWFPDREATADHELVTV